MNLPNKLTVLRMILVPIIIAIYLIPFGGDVHLGSVTIAFNQLIVCLLFIVASFTDFLDGKIARKNHLITTFGKFMDPIADKLLVNSLLILLAYSGTIPVVFTIIMIARDTVVDAIRCLAAQNNVVIAASMLGKAKTFTQMFGIIFLLLNNFPFAYINIPVDMILITLAAIISVVSGCDYFIKSKDFILESM